MRGGFGMGLFRRIRLQCCSGLGRSMATQLGPLGGGIHLGTRDHRSIGYRVPVEWASMALEEREMGNLAAFKRRSRAGLLGDYAAFVCRVTGCGVCGGPGG